MSTLVLGLSHRSAPLAVLDRAALTSDAVGQVLSDVAAGEAQHVTEAVVLATCNRVEIYAEVGRFHDGLEEARSLLLRHGRLGVAEATPHLYVHFDDRAVHHAFSVACGLDSLVVGEPQILGQVREALRTAQAASTVGSQLNDLMQTALRVGKRAHAETRIDAAGRTLATEALAASAAAGAEVAGARAVVVGAGSIAALAVAALREGGAGPITVVNRGRERAERLASGADVTALPWDSLAATLATADLVVCCTGAAGVVLDAATVASAVHGRAGRAPLAVVDLALPHDVDPAVRELPGVALVTLADVADRAGAEPTGTDAAGGPAVAAAAVRAIVAEEVLAFAAHARASRVAPTVAALRALADDVIAAELARFAQRRPDLDPALHDEVGATVRRVVSKLLHEPTVRVKALADGPDGPGYERVLRELFALDPRTVAAVTELPSVPPEVLP
jgi:glutamyl-tRNA reductase